MKFLKKNESEKLQSIDLNWFCHILVKPGIGLYQKSLRRHYKQDKRESIPARTCVCFCVNFVWILSRWPNIGYDPELSTKILCDMRLAAAGGVRLVSVEHEMQYQGRTKQDHLHKNDPVLFLPWFCLLFFVISSVPVEVWFVMMPLASR